MRKEKIYVTALIIQLHGLQNFVMMLNFWLKPLTHFHSFNIPFGYALSSINEQKRSCALHLRLRNSIHFSMTATSSVIQRLSYFEKKL